MNGDPGPSLIPLFYDFADLVGFCNGKRFDIGDRRNEAFLEKDAPGHIRQNSLALCSSCEQYGLPTDIFAWHTLPPTL